MQVKAIDVEKFGKKATVIVYAIKSFLCICEYWRGKFWRMAYDLPIFPLPKFPVYGIYVCTLLNVTP